MDPSDKLALEIVEVYAAHSYKEIKDMMHLKSINSFISRGLVYAITTNRMQIGEDIVTESIEKRIILSISHEEVGLLIINEAHALIEKLVCSNAKLITNETDLSAGLLKAKKVAESR